MTEQIGSQRAGYTLVYIPNSRIASLTQSDYQHQHTHLPGFDHQREAEEKKNWFYS
jgi:hypothetical protein